ncbi:MAG: GHKL domain-containing protein [Saprospiraceae bacterium]|nr:GHKL domain-containing protein [Saprospiraceae bacterium]
MRSFKLGVVWRLCLIFTLTVLTVLAYLKYGYPPAIALFFLTSIFGYDLYQYAIAVNRKLKRLFESIQYQDFAITFRADSYKGNSFSDLNQELNAVIRSFNQVRAERESIIHFIQAIIQQINVGIMSYNTDGKVELSNQAIHKLLGIYKISHISDIHHEEFLECLDTLQSGQNRLVTHNNNELSVGVKEIILRDRRIRLVTVHNIRSELQNRELEAWQNLTKVLRHEIMNSVTPIVSLSETMKDIIHHDFHDVQEEKHKMAVEDLQQAVDTIVARSKGIMHFVFAYREFTSIPQPIFKETIVSDLFENIKTLYEGRPNGELSIEIKNDFPLFIDTDQISQVLINLIKNAFESVPKTTQAKVSLIAYIQDQQKIIEVQDNGTGVPSDKIDQIFVPFFTTKPEGSGIGLSLSRQIMHLHNGNITYKSNEPGGAIFVLQF